MTFSLQASQSIHEFHAAMILQRLQRELLLNLAISEIKYTLREVLISATKHRTIVKIHQ